MPIFEYACEKCGKGFERLEKAGTAEAPSCPECGALEVKKKLSSFAAGGASSASCNTGGG